MLSLPSLCLKRFVLLLVFAHYYMYRGIVIVEVELWDRWFASWLTESQVCDCGKAS